VAINLMAISTVPEFELNKGLEMLGQCQDMDMLYLVDSFGSLYYEQIEDLMRRYKDAMQHGQQIGIHAHNNQQMAYVNTICCAINGARRHGPRRGQLPDRTVARLPAESEVPPASDH